MQLTNIMFLVRITLDSLRVILPTSLKGFIKLFLSTCKIKKEREQKKITA